MVLFQGESESIMYLIGCITDVGSLNYSRVNSKPDNAKQYLSHYDNEDKVLELIHMGSLRSIGDTPNKCVKDYGYFSVEPLNSCTSLDQKIDWFKKTLKRYGRGFGCLFFDDKWHFYGD